MVEANDDKIHVNVVSDENTVDIYDILLLLIFFRSRNIDIESKLLLTAL